MGSDSSTGEKVRNWLAFIVSLIALSVSGTAAWLSYSQQVLSQDLQLLQFLEDARDSLSGSENASRYGSLTTDQQKLEAAQRSIERARRIDDQNPEVFLYDGMYNEALGRWTEATKACQKAKQLSERPAWPKAMVCLANILIDQGRLSEAEKVLRAGDSQGADSAVVQANLCLVLSKQGKLSEAEEACSRAVLVEPRSLPAQNNFGIVLMQQGEIDAAEKRFNIALSVSSNENEPDILANLGLAQQYNHKDKAAIETFEKALQLDPTNSFVKEKLAALYRKMGDDLRATVLETGTPRQVEIR